ncbi:MAG: hypothetical protein WDN45_03650 [Caulobacteraceae bacterium]
MAGVFRDRGGHRHRQDLGRRPAAAPLADGGVAARGGQAVASGYDPERPQDSDAAALLRALGRPVTVETVEAMTPIRFKAPLSPDQAALRKAAGSPRNRRRRPAGRPWPSPRARC